MIIAGGAGCHTQGKSYRGNIEGSDPRCSFHWVGTSDRLYVFEAPIDLLAFLTLYPDGWQQHSYPKKIKRSVPHEHTENRPHPQTGHYDSG